MNPSARKGRGKPGALRKKQRKNHEELNIEEHERKRQNKRRGPSTKTPKRQSALKDNRIDSAKSLCR